MIPIAPHRATAPRIRIFSHHGRLGNFLHLVPCVRALFMIERTWKEFHIIRPTPLSRKLLKRTLRAVRKSPRPKPRKCVSTFLDANTHLDTASNTRLAGHLQPVHAQRRPKRRRQSTEKGQKKSQKEKKGSIGRTPPSPEQTRNQHRHRLQRCHFLNFVFTVFICTQKVTLNHFFFSTLI